MSTVQSHIARRSAHGSCPRLRSVSRRSFCRRLARLFLGEPPRNQATRQTLLFAQQNRLLDQSRWLLAQPLEQIDLLSVGQQHARPKLPPRKNIDESFQELSEYGNIEITQVGDPQRSRGKLRLLSGRSPVRTLPRLDFDVRKPAVLKIQFGLQFQSRLACIVAASATGKSRFFAVRQGDHRAIEQRDSREAFQQRRERLVRLHDNFYRAAKQFFEKRREPARVSLLDRLRRDNRATLGRHLGQVLIGSAGVFKKPQDKCARQRRMREAPPAQHHWSHRMGGINNLTK